MTNDKKKKETILFTTGKFLEIEEISRLAEIKDLKYLKVLLEELKKEYNERETSLEIINENTKWRLNIKKDFLHLTEKLLTDTELDKPTQETLAVIAYKNPALQSEIVKIRGNTAYDHIKILKELDFITTEPSGKTRIIKLTNKFYDYFDIVEDQLKSKMQIVKEGIRLDGGNNEGENKT